MSESDAWQETAIINKFCWSSPIRISVLGFPYLFLRRPYNSRRSSRDIGFRCMKLQKPPLVHSLSGINSARRVNSSSRLARPAGVHKLPEGLASVQGRTSDSNFAQVCLSSGAKHSSGKKLGETRGGGLTSLPPTLTSSASVLGRGDHAAGVTKDTYRPDAKQSSAPSTCCHDFSSRGKK